MELKRNSWNYYSEESKTKGSGKGKLVLKIVAPLTCAFCFYFLYSGRFDNFFYDKTLIFIPALMVLIIIPVMLVQTANVWIQNDNIKVVGVLLGVSSVLVNGPFFGYWIGVSEEKAFANYGIKTKGIVTQA